MKKIIIDSGFSSGLSPNFNSVGSIEIEDKAFADGGFGEVYHCISINGLATATKQVVKLFKESNKGAEKQNFDTTLKLQKKIDLKNQALLAQEGRSLLDLYPAFKGVPQFSFKGNINGKPVVGFTSHNLVDLGFTDFEHFLQDSTLLNQYQTAPMEQKMLMAYQLVSAFKILEDFNFIHADLKPGALFINLNSVELALIDYDSGVITEKSDDEPLTWGAANDWVAPEIWQQQSSIQRREKIKVDLYSDRWSVAIGIHYLLTAFHPLFFLTELSPRVTKDYFANAKWPYIDKNKDYFEKTNEAIYDQYLPWMTTAIPQEVRDKFSNTMNFGYTNQVARTSYNHWKTVLKNTQNPPKIKFFKSDKDYLQDSRPVLFSWETENAVSISLNGIDVTGKNNYSTQLKNDLEIELKVFNLVGEASEKIKITTSKERPVINQFTSSKGNHISTKQDLELSWDISNFETIEISGIGDVTKKNSIKIKAPKVDTIFTITATTFFGQISTKKLHLTVNKTPPHIIHFLSSQNTVFSKNDPVRLTWNITDAESVYIDNGVGDVTNHKKGVEVLPRKDTLYTITATSYFGAVSKEQVRVSVSKVPPVIKKFESSKLLVSKIEDVVLSWDVEGAEKIFISQGIGEVTNKNYISCEISRDTTFVLTAVSYFGSESTSLITIQVLKVPPIIKAFHPDKSIVVDDKPILLSWEVVNASYVFIDNGVGNVSSIGTKEVFITEDTTYTLIATSSFGAISKRTIKVQTSKIPPLITVFKSQTLLLVEGNSTLLSWEVKNNPYEIVINNGVGKVGPSGSISIAPTTDKTYILVAKNVFGHESRAHVYLKTLQKTNLNFEAAQLNQVPTLNKTP